MSVPTGMKYAAVLAFGIGLGLAVGGAAWAIQQERMAARSIGGGVEQVARVHRPKPKPPEKTVVVLSSGGPGAVAEIGAIDAFHAASIKIDGIVGTGTGALIGALYANNPQANLAGEYRRFATALGSARSSDQGGLATIFGIAAVVLTGGAAGAVLPALGGAAGGAMLASPEKIGRTNRALNAGILGGAEFSQLKIPLVVAYHESNPAGTAAMTAVTAAVGNVASAVSQSLFDPCLKDDQLHGAHLADPSSPRRLCVDVDDAVSVLHATRVIAINATGRPAVYHMRRDCQVEEIEVNAGVQQEASNGVRILAGDGAFADLEPLPAHLWL